MAKPPVYCTLNPSALKARRENLSHALVHRADALRKLPDGYVLRFKAEDDILALIARAVDAERQCCRFLRFTVTVEPDGGPVSLKLTGPAGTPEFLAAMLDF
jgi:hypothetical protein